MFARIAAAFLMTITFGVGAQAESNEGEASLRPLEDWSGFYLGATTGAHHSPRASRREHFDGDLVSLDVRNGLFPEIVRNSKVAAIGGVTLGYNLQRGALVGGLEIDYAFTDLNVNSEFSRVDPNPDPTFNGVQTITRYETDVDQLATIRVRAGRSSSRMMIYATGGLALGQVRNDFTLDLPGLGYSSPGWSQDGYRFGYVIGAGVERRLSERVSLKLELLHYDLDDTIVEGRDPTSFPGQSIDYRFNNAGVLGQVGVNVRF